MGIPLTDIKGIGPSTASLLMAHGIRSAEDLAVTTLADISAVPGFGGVRAQQVRQAAAALLAGPSATPPHAETPPSPQADLPLAVPLIEPLPPAPAEPAVTLESPPSSEDVKKKSLKKKAQGKQKDKQKKKERETSKDGAKDKGKKQDKKRKNKKSKKK